MKELATSARLWMAEVSTCPCCVFAKYSASTYAAHLQVCSIEKLSQDWRADRAFAIIAP